MADKDEYFEKLLGEYSKSFDITRGYKIGNITALSISCSWKRIT